MSLAWIPNAICVLRILLVAPSALALLAGRYELTLLLFGVAAVSDGLDGWLAKHFDWTSRLGKILDPIADKLLLVTVFLTLVWTGLVPLWLGVAVVVRDVLIVGGAIAYRLLIGYVEGRPTPISKLNTLLQLSFVLAVIAAAAWRNVPRPLVVAIGAATFVTTVVSGLDYVLTYAREAIRAGRAAARAAP
ncbi:MAG TPA: CDP-alcohol phosphatidyltransferase family protein [Steroidobacteraceae bacterium]|nr:CDP-alcohol phosphatidyltransferase family protein [Steroidobacteraceae bacterium]